MTSISFFLVFLLQPASAPTTPAAPASQPTSMPTTAQVAAPVKTGQPIHRGSPFTMKKAQPIDTMMATVEQMDGQTVRIDGKVKAVCRKKGCWMTLTGTDKTSVARITFKDYGFFVPLDCAGSTASVEGVIKLKTLSDAERAHLAQDAGKAVQAVPKHEVRIVATAVSLVRP
ncbi:MAG: DUF4920 domain-containing protein [Myxococcota bacterium]|nr:DUF4920 domain-containing protein [Myxococcota bacterium]